jgi:hypothetical protein
MAERDDATQAGPDEHEKARQMTEDALGAYAEGDRKKGDRLADEAQRIDGSAVEEVLEDLDEDAGSNHDTATRSG